MLGSPQARTCDELHLSILIQNLDPSLLGSLALASRVIPYDYTELRGRRQIVRIGFPTSILNRGTPLRLELTLDAPVGLVTT